jgi:hypothetical protein
MDSTTENDYFELEPFDQYKPQEVNNTLFIIIFYFFFLFLSSILFCALYMKHVLLNIF